jgi:hypothetical protein
MPPTRPREGAALRLGSRVRATSRRQAAHHVEDATEQLHGGGLERHWSWRPSPSGVKLTWALCSCGAPRPGQGPPGRADPARHPRPGGSPRPVLSAFRPHDQLVARCSLGLRARAFVVLVTGGRGVGMLVAVALLGLGSVSRSSWSAPQQGAAPPPRGPRRDGPAAGTRRVVDFAVAVVWVGGAAVPGFEQELVEPDSSASGCR